MMRFYFSPRFTQHQTTPGHPERPARVSVAYDSLRSSGLLAKLTPGEFQVVDLASIGRIHSATMVDRAEAVCKAGGGQLDGDTPVSTESFDVARLAAGAATTAVDNVLAGKSKTAFCLSRPPGHHATPKRSMGFCLFNNVALAAQRALTEHKLSRVLIVDWDVHHGNGTQDIFYDDDRVLFFSAHRYPFYPGSGAKSETGAGRGLGYTVNMPVAYGTSRTDYRKQFEAQLVAAAQKIRPELVLISAGFDAHHADPIGDLGLEVEDFVELTKSVCGIAKEHSGGKVVSLLEGGYNLDVLAQCVTAHVRELMAFEESNA